MDQTRYLGKESIDTLGELGSQLGNTFLALGLIRSLCDRGSCNAYAYNRGCRTSARGILQKLRVNVLCWELDITHNGPSYETIFNSHLHVESDNTRHAVSVHTRHMRMP